MAVDEWAAPAFGGGKPKGKGKGKGTKFGRGKHDDGKQGWPYKPYNPWGKGTDGHQKSNLDLRAKLPSEHLKAYNKPTVVTRLAKARQDGQVQDGPDQSKFPYRKRHQGPCTKPEQVPVAHCTLFLKGKCPNPCCQDLPRISEKAEHGQTAPAVPCLHCWSSRCVGMGRARSRQRHRIPLQP